MSKIITAFIAGYLFFIPSILICGWAWDLFTKLSEFKKTGKGIRDLPKAIKNIF